MTADKQLATEGLPVPYERPSLVVLGTAAALTHAKGQHGKDKGTNSSG